MRTKPASGRLICRGASRPPADAAEGGGSAVSMYWFFVAKSKNGDRFAYRGESPGEKDRCRYFCARVTAT